MKPGIEIHADHAAASRACASRIVASARRSLSAAGRFTLALTGGSTPLDCYRILARDHAGDLDWARVDFLIGDERMVACEDPRSNFGAARRAWLDSLALPAQRLHPMPVESDDDASARGYERELRALAPNGLDLVLLGLGDDGHIASLFPGRVDALPPARWVIAVRAPASSPVERRLSLSFSAIAAASEALFLVTGASKAKVLAGVLEGGSDLPAARVRARAGVHFILDEAAASALSAREPRPAS